MHRHFREIQIRSFYLLFSFLLTMITTFWFSLELIYIFVYPFLYYEKQFICTELTEPLWSTLQICMWISFYLFFPLSIYQIVCFFSPSCYLSEKKKLVAISIFFLVLWNLSLFVCHFYLAPKVWHLLLNYQVSSSVISIQLETRISSYIESTCHLFNFAAFSFQTPLLLYLLLDKNYVNGHSLSRNRTWLLIAFLLGASLLSPPDWRSQLILAALFFIFFELTLWFAFLHQAARKKSTFVLKQ